MMVTPANPKELAKAQKFDKEANEAEILLSAERAMGRRFKHLDKDSYPKFRIEAKPESDFVDEAHGWRKGQHVRLTLNNPLAEEVVSGTIGAVSKDGLWLMVQGRKYHVSLAVRTFI